MLHVLQDARWKKLRHAVNNITVVGGATMKAGTLVVDPFASNNFIDLGTATAMFSRLSLEVQRGGYAEQCRRHAFLCVRSKRAEAAASVYRLLEAGSARCLEVLLRAPTASRMKHERPSALTRMLVPRNRIHSHRHDRRHSAEDLRHKRSCQSRLDVQGLCHIGERLCSWNGQTSIQNCKMLQSFRQLFH